MRVIREKKPWEPFIEKGYSFLGSSCQKRLAYKILFGGGESHPMSVSYVGLPVIGVVKTCCDYIVHPC